jgi:hypothetical protein
MSSDYRREQLNEFVAGVSVETLEKDVPGAIVVESDSTTLVHAPGVPCTGRLIVNKQIMASRLGYNGPPWVEMDPRTGHQMGTTELPTRYLRFSSDNWVNIKLPGQPTSSRFGPWELETIDSSTRRVIAFYYDEIVTKATFPPILTSGGWLFERLPSPVRGWNGPTAFVNHTLPECTQPQFY